MRKMLKGVLLLVCLMIGIQYSNAQQTAKWNHKQCAVVLTYDDAIDVDLDHAIPVLDSLGLKGTFYLIGSSPVVNNRLNEWRLVAKHGHELGNHTLYHPCDGSRPGRSFVTPDNDLSKYTVKREVNEARATNTLLKAIDGKNKRTFAFPCGDLTINGENFYDQLKPDFVAARGVAGGLEDFGSINLDNIKCYMINGQSAAYMIGLVKQAMEQHKLIVFLFHGVGGGHNINVDLKEHSKLLHFIKDNNKQIWNAPMVEVATFIKDQNTPGKS